MAVRPFTAPQVALTPASPLAWGPFTVTNLSALAWRLTFPGGSWTDLPGVTVQFTIERFDTTSQQWVFWGGDTVQQGHNIDRQGNVSGGMTPNPPLNGQFRIRVAPSGNITLGITGTTTADTIA